jgi:hypothetical protein
MIARDARQVWGELLALTVLVLLAPVAGAAGPVTAGAYCPIPEPGEAPGCLDPAKAEYEDFFRAVDAGQADDAQLARVEAAVARGAGEAEGYLALSSLAYGYYQLSREAARTPGANPEIAARLERWNSLLGQVYGAHGDAAPWREAVRAAADDLQRRAPPVELACRGADGEARACSSTDAMLQSLERATGDVGYRGGLERVLERWFGSDES